MIDLFNPLHGIEAGVFAVFGADLPSPNPKFETPHANIIGPICPPNPRFDTPYASVLFPTVPPNPK
jgi:hypothetical protein